MLLPHTQNVTVVNPGPNVSLSTVSVTDAWNSPLEVLEEKYDKLEKIMRDILPLLAKDHPELVLKHMEFFEKT
jgi:hypothetical protein